MDRFQKGPGMDREEKGDPDSPSLDEAVDSLFMQSFEEVSDTTGITSGDEETDRAIDLAVDTLFVEEPETEIPETQQVEATVVDLEEPAAPAVEPAAPSLEPPPEEPPLERFEPPPITPEYESPAATPEFEHHPSSYDEAAAQATGAEPTPAFEGEELPGFEFESTEPEPTPSGDVTRIRPKTDSEDLKAVRRLQEAILTLEWEISSRSVTTLANELQRIRNRFQDNVTVDFAALSMRLALDYVVKRMSRAHPESVRFLIDVSRYLEGCLNSSRQDPLGTFHQILTRYETFKSVVRKAEGIPDRDSALTKNLEIKDRKAFSEMVKRQAATLAIAGISLAERIGASEDPENLIRSFRFLVTRSFNRILASTQKKTKKRKKKKKRAKRLSR